MRDEGGKTRMRKKIILDVDPGHDDAIAILLAGKSEGIDLLGITVVAGNAPLDRTVRNALTICDIAGLGHVPVHRGMDRPLLRDLVTAPEIHGESGLGGPELPVPRLECRSAHAVDFIVETVCRFPGEVTLVATGPLTNIAMAFLVAPHIKAKVKEIVLMGGAIGLGNVTPAAEFNVYVDPEAADIVFRSGLPITMLPLELTHQALITAEDRAAIRKIGTRLAGVVADLLEFFSSTYEKVFGMKGAPLHDPCTIALLVDPTLVETQAMHVAIETRGVLTAGRTVCDVYGVGGHPCNARVGMRLDKEGFLDLLLNAIEGYGDVWPI